jgi:hypothetical protein
MKRFFLSVLALLLVLCGCAAQPEPNAMPTEPTVTEAAPTEEPAGLYDAASDLEEATNGAVRVYPLGRTDTTDIAYMGEDLLLFSGAEFTSLTKLSGENLYVSAAATLNCYICPTDPAVQVSEKGMTYYDAQRKDLVFLSAQLQEVKRISLPATIRGTPALSADRSTLYYCTANALRCIDLDSGLDRFLKELHFSSQTLTALLCDDTVIACAAEDEGGNQALLYISTKTGQLLTKTAADINVWTRGSFYLATHQDGVYQEFLIGDSEFGPALIAPPTYRSTAYSLMEIGGMVLATEDIDLNTTQLDYYDLRSAKRTATLTLDGLEPLFCFLGSDDPQTVWFLRYDLQYGCEVLYSWDLTKTATGDHVSYLSSRYTAERPDYAGLAACREIADSLSEKHGVQILLWTDAVSFQPWDYTLVPEYQVRVIQEELKALEEFLSLYPEGFLKTAAESTGSGRIQICLVRSILGNEAAAGALSEAVGLQYWDDSKNAYLALAVGQERLAQNACHEIFHIIESRVMTLSKLYDDWNTLNPKGFTYDYDYIANLDRSDSQWLEGKNRAFIDTYSMSYPKEDRARIMEYAMRAGNESFFESEIMQKKLRQLCLGIRKAFGLEKSNESFFWEQYLKEPLK